MNQKEKNWSFTEILGWHDDVVRVVNELKAANILHGSLSSKEEKGEKLFVQYYSCNSDVCKLTPQEISIYNEISIRNYVHMEFTYNGKDSIAFPVGEKEGFPVKYWEWWMAK